MARNNGNTAVVRIALWIKIEKLWIKLGIILWISKGPLGGCPTDTENCPFEHGQCPNRAKVMHRRKPYSMRLVARFSENLSPVEKEKNTKKNKEKTSASWGSAPPAPPSYGLRPRYALPPGIPRGCAPRYAHLLNRPPQGAIQIPRLVNQRNCNI